MNSHRIAVIPGDGIGLEVIEAGKRVLEVLAEDNTDVTFDFVDFDWSSERYLKTGQYIPDGGIEELCFARRPLDAFTVGVGDGCRRHRDHHCRQQCDCDEERMASRKEQRFSRE